MSYENYVASAAQNLMRNAAPNGAQGWMAVLAGLAPGIERLIAERDHLKYRQQELDLRRQEADAQNRRYEAQIAHANEQEAQRQQEKADEKRRYQGEKVPSLRDAFLPTLDMDPSNEKTQGPGIEYHGDRLRISPEAWKQRLAPYGIDPTEPWARVPEYTEQEQRAELARRDFVEKERSKKAHLRPDQVIIGDRIAYQDENGDIIPGLGGDRFRDTEGGIPRLTAYVDRDGNPLVYDPNAKKFFPVPLPGGAQKPDKRARPATLAEMKSLWKIQHTNGSDNDPLPGHPSFREYVAGGMFEMDWGDISAHGSPIQIPHPPSSDTPSPMSSHGDAPATPPAPKIVRTATGPNGERIGLGDDGQVYQLAGGPNA